MPFRPMPGPNPNRLDSRFDRRPHRAAPPARPPAGTTRATASSRYRPASAPGARATGRRRHRGRAGGRRQELGRRQRRRSDSAGSRLTATVKRRRSPIPGKPDRVEPLLGQLDRRHAALAERRPAARRRHHDAARPPSRARRSPVPCADHRRDRRRDVEHAADGVPGLGLLGTARDSAPVSCISGRNMACRGKSFQAPSSVRRQRDDAAAAHSPLHDRRRAIVEAGQHMIGRRRRQGRGS